MALAKNNRNFFSNSNFPRNFAAGTFSTILQSIIETDKTYDSWWGNLPRMYVGKQSLPHIDRNTGRIAVGGVNGPRGPMKEDIGTLGSNSVLFFFVCILGCLSFGLNILL
jgi:hypothetical protein